MEARYSRNVPALTEGECELLRKKRAAVIGCGGLGGHLIELLARVGVGFIRAVDGDVFEESNLNRQLLSEVPVLGTGKAEAAKERIARVNPDVEMEAVPVFLTKENAEELIQDCDVVLDALDNPESRRVLAEACQRVNLPYVYGAIRGWVAQAAVSMPEDRLIEKLYPEGSVVTDKSVLSFTPALCASLQAALCVKVLTGRPVETGMIYYYDLLEQEAEQIPMG